MTVMKMMIVAKMITKMKIHEIKKDNTTIIMIITTTKITVMLMILW